MKTISKFSKRSKSFTVTAGLALALASCASPEPSRDKAAEANQPQTSSATEQASEAPAVQEPAAETSGGGFMPACLNLVENDRRVEFSRSKLIVTDNGKPKSLDLDNGDDVRCEKLRVVEKARVPSVEIVYLTRESGTSVNVLERMMGVASIKEGKWIAKPLIIERLFRASGGITTTPKMAIKWSEEQGRPVLTRTDIESKQSETIRP